MTRPPILIMSALIQNFVGLSSKDYDLTILSDQPDRDGFLAEHGPKFEAVVAGGMERIDSARMDLMPNLRLIAVIATGMSGLDLEAARQRGIAVTNAGSSNAGDVADFAVMLMLAARRNLIGGDTHVRGGQWPKARLPASRSIASQRVGIVGLGHIGLGVAQRLAPFGCDVRWWGPNPKPDVPWLRMERLAELAEWATTLIIAVSGKADTSGLIDAPILNALGPDGLIINVARGFVIDEPAMIAALREGRLGGAGLDVFAHEPDNGAQWADLPNVLLAPHSAGATIESLEQVMFDARDNLRRLFAGETLINRVV